MAKIGLTEAQEIELARLSESEYVQLARLEQRIKYRERQRLYTLRNMEKRGKALVEAGFTLENMKARLLELEAEGTEADE